MHILIIRVSAIGDVIHTLPALFLLKHYFPHAHIHWVVQQKVASLLEGHPLLKHVWVVSDKYLSAYNIFSTLKTIKALRGIRWDAIIDFQGLVKTSLLHVGLKGKKFGFSSHHVRERLSCLATRYHDTPEYFNIVQKNLSLASLTAQYLGAISLSPAPEHLVSTFTFSLDDTKRRVIDQWFIDHHIEKCILLCPNTTWQSKHWPVTRWVEVIEAFSEDPSVTLVLVGVTMGAAAAHIAHICYERKLRVVMCPPWDLLSMADVVKRAALVIAPDSGMLHLADYLGTQVIGIFGPTSKVMHGPFWTRGNNDQCFQVACPHRGKKKHEGVRDCMEALLAQDVIIRIKTIINRL